MPAPPAKVGEGSGDAAKPVLLVACGNPWMGDDGFAVQVARAVASVAPESLDILLAGTRPADILESLPGRRALLLVDAALAPDHPLGTVLDLDYFAPDRPPLLSATAVSTHMLGIAQQLELARALGLLPEAVRLLAVVIDAPKSQPQAGLSPQVAARVPEIVARVRQWVGQWTGGIAQTV